MRAAAVMFAAFACACGPPSVADGVETSGGETSATAATTTSTTTSTSASTTTTTSTTGVDTSSSGEVDGGCGAFICEPDCGSNCPEACDQWAEDCPPGEKCMPWADDGGSAWNATKCVPIARDPKQPGEPCTVEGSGVSGIDDCDIHSMCWAVDPKTNMGTCVPMCVGDEFDPSCESPCDECFITGAGIPILCLPTCSPLGQECGDGLACYPAPIDFGCVPDASGDFGSAGDPCEYVNECDPGMLCASAEEVPGCDWGGGCCTPFCDTAAADPCPGAAPGVECVPWFQDGQPRQQCAELSVVGVCVLP